MANNCLVTKLKSVVSNNNLRKLREMRVTVKSSPASYENHFFITASKNIELNVVGSGHIGTNSSAITETNIPITANVETKVYLENSDYEVSISDKYSVKSIRIGRYANSYGYINVEDLKYATLSGIELFENSIGNLNILNFTSTPKIACYIGNNATFNLDQFTNVTFNSFYTNTIRISGNVSGSIANLKVANGVTQLELYYSNLEGAIEDFIRNNSRETGTISVLAKGSNITYGGQTFNEQKIKKVTYNFATGEYTTES